MSKSILIIDDSRTIRCQVAMALRAGGYEVFEAANGQEGLAAAETLQSLHLIICDVNMPKMDGAEFVAAFRNQSGHEEIPIIMLTSEADPEMLALTKRTGACGWIMKPVRADLLLATVRRIAGPPHQGETSCRRR